jgi:hypothetical protein
MFTTFHAQNAAFGLPRPAEKNRPDKKTGNKSTNLKVKLTRDYFLAEMIFRIKTQFSRYRLASLGLKSALQPGTLPFKLWQQVLSHKKKQ